MTYQECFETIKSMWATKKSKVSLQLGHCSDKIFDIVNCSLPSILSPIYKDVFHFTSIKYK
jgi:hypothetical protein